MPTCRWAAAWSRPSTGRTRSARRDPDLHRQPDRLAASRRAAGRAARLPRRLDDARHRPGRDPRGVPGQPGGPGRRTSFERSVELLATELRRARPSARGSSTCTSGRIAGDGVDAGVRRIADGVRATAIARVRRRSARRDGARRRRGAVDRRHARARELRRQRVRARGRPRRARGLAEAIAARGRAGRTGSASASTPRTPGAPGSTSRRPMASMPSWPSSTTGSASIDSSWSTSTTRAPSAGRGSTGTSTSVPDGSARWGWRTCCAPGARPRRLLPRDAGDGRGLRRGQRRSGPVRWPPASRWRCCRPRRSTCAAAPEHGRRRHDGSALRGRLRGRSTGATPRPAGLLAPRRPAAPAEPRDARHVGRRPGPRHARAPGARPRRDRAAAGSADLDRRCPPRRLVLLPAQPGGLPDRRRVAARGRVAHRGRRRRGGRGRVVARPVDRRVRSRASRPGW